MNESRDKSRRNSQRMPFHGDQTSNESRIALRPADQGKVNKNKQYLILMKKCSTGNLYAFFMHSLPLCSN